MSSIEYRTTTGITKFSNERRIHFCMNRTNRYPSSGSSLNKTKKCPLYLCSFNLIYVNGKKKQYLKILLFSWWCFVSKPVIILSTLLCGPLALMKYYALFYYRLRFNINPCSAVGMLTKKNYLLEALAST